MSRVPTKPTGYRFAPDVFAAADIPSVSAALHAGGFSQGFLSALEMAKRIDDKQRAQGMSPERAGERMEATLKARWGDDAEARMATVRAAAEPLRASPVLHRLLSETGVGGNPQLAQAFETHAQLQALASEKPNG